MDKFEKSLIGFKVRILRTTVLYTVDYRVKGTKFPGFMPHSDKHEVLKGEIFKMYRPVFKDNVGARWFEIALGPLGLFKTKRPEAKGLFVKASNVRILKELK